MKRKLIVAFSVTGCLILIGVIFATNSPQGQGKINEHGKSQFEINEQGNVKRFETNMANLEISNNLQKYGVEIVGSSNSRFDIELRRLIGDSNQDLAPLINVAKPFSVIIINNSKKDVVGCSLKWEMSTPQGIKVFPQIQSTPGELMGMKPVDPNIKGRTSLISAGHVKLFSFDNNIDQIFIKAKMTRYYKQRLTLTDLYLSENALREIDDGKKRLLNAFSHISVSIDGIFFSDGTFVGSDSFFYFDSMRGRIEAHYDLISLLSESPSEATLSEAVTNYAGGRNKGRRRRPNPAESPETAFQQGYEMKARSLGEEISRRRTKFTDQVIADDFLVNRDSKRVVLRKLK